jgi:hypothetical protein
MNTMHKSILKIAAYSCLFAGILLTGCEFAPNEINEVYIDQNWTLPDSLFVEFNFSTDTVYIPEGNTAIIEYDAGDANIYWAKIYIDDKLCDEKYSANGELKFSTSFYGFEENTPYPMRIEFFEGSGSGSLADMYRMEGLIFYGEWIVYFVDESYIGSQITGFNHLDGRLEVHWSEYKSTGFQQYILCHGASGFMAKDTVDKVNEYNVTSTIDSGFVGYSRAYFLKTVTEYGSYLSQTAFFEDDMPQVYAGYTGGTTFSITWDKSKYMNNIAGYKLYESLKTYNNGVEIAFIENNQDTSYNYDHAKFAVRTYFYLQPVPVKSPPEINDPDEIAQYSTHTDDVYGADRIPGIAFFNAPIGQYCYYSPFKILKFDCVGQTFVDSVEASGNTIVSSPDGNYLLKATYEVFSLYNSSDLSLNKEVNYQEITGTSFFTYNEAISNNGIVVFSTDKFYILDIINENLIGTFDISDMEDDWDRSLRISPDGNYILVRYTLSGYSGANTVLLERQPDTAVIIWDDDVKFYQFDFINPNFCYYKNNTLFTKSLNTLSTIKQVSVGDKYIYNIDFNTYEFITLNNSNDKIKIYDYVNGSLKYEVQTLDFNEYHRVYLSNRTIFYDQGFKRLLTYE